MELKKIGDVPGFIRKSSGIFADTDPKPKFVCAPLDVVARTRDVGGGNWGLYVQFYDDDRKLHTMSIPSADLSTDGSDVCTRLRANGLRGAPGSSREMMAYLFWANPKKKI